MIEHFDGMKALLKSNSQNSAACMKLFLADFYFATYFHDRVCGLQGKKKNNWKKNKYFEETSKRQEW